MFQHIIHLFTISDDAWDKKAECWICYDSDRTDAGPMIEPCACKGDVGAVHHECLKHWLIEVCISDFLPSDGSL